MTVIKVLRSAAFTDLASEVGRFGAMLRFEAEKQFGAELVAQAIRQRVCLAQDTKLGSVLLLLHLGRQLIGLTGVFHRTEEALMNAVCLRGVGRRLERAGVTIDLTVRKRSIVFSTATKRVLVLAQYGGYALAAMRRLNRDFVEQGDFDQIQIYCYLTPSEVAELTKPLYTPERNSTPVDPARFLVYSLPLPKPRRQALTLPEGALD